MRLMSLVIVMFSFLAGFALVTPSRAAERPLETVARAGEFLERVNQLPYRPGRTGGHVAELRSASRAVLLLELVEAMPAGFKRQLGGMLVWQWFGLAFFVSLLALGIAAIA